MKDNGIRCLLFLLTAMVLSSPSGEAAKKALPYRPCQSRDLVGTWQMVQQITPNPVQAGDPFYYPYQRYVFSRKGEMKHLTSTTPISEAQKENQRTAPTLSAYQLNPDGSVVIYRKDSQKTQQFLCTVITQPSSGLKTPMKSGDLLISYYTQKNKPPILQRLLRKEVS